MKTYNNTLVTQYNHYIKLLCKVS